MFLGFRKAPPQAIIFLPFRERTSLDHGKNDPRDPTSDALTRRLLTFESDMKYFSRMKKYYFAFFGIVLFVNSVAAQKVYTDVMPTSDGSQVYNISAGDAYQIPIEMKKNGYIAGHFEAYINRSDLNAASIQLAGSLIGVRAPMPTGDVELIILDEYNYELFLRKTTYRAVYSSNRVRYGEFKQPLRAGNYRLIINNRHASFTSKWVKLTIPEDPAETKEIDLNSGHTNQTSGYPSVEPPAPPSPPPPVQYTVPAGQWIPLRITGYWMRGRFDTVGGPIEMIMLGDDNFRAYQAGLQWKSDYYSGNTTSHVFNFAPRGRNLVFRNLNRWNAVTVYLQLQ